MYKNGEKRWELTVTEDSRCRYCGNSVESHNEKFCNDACRDAHILDIEKKIKKAVENDSSHTEKMVNDS